MVCSRFPHSLDALNFLRLCPPAKWPAPPGDGTAGGCDSSGQGRIMPTAQGQKPRRWRGGWAWAPCCSSLMPPHRGRGESVLETPTGPFQPRCSRLAAGLSEADRQPVRREPSPASSLPACKASVLRGQGRTQKPSGSGVWGELQGSGNIRGASSKDSACCVTAPSCSCPAVPWPSSQSRSQSSIPSHTTQWEPAWCEALVWALGICSERRSLGPAPQSL